MNFDKVPVIGEHLTLAWNEWWAPILDKLNYIMEQSGLPIPTFSVPMQAILALLFLWLLLRVVRNRRAKTAIEDKKAKPAPAEEEIIAAEPDEEPEPEFGVEDEAAEPYREKAEDDAAEPDQGVEASFEPEAEAELEPPAPELEHAQGEEVAWDLEQVDAEAAEIEVTEPEAVPEPEPEEPKVSFFQRLKNGLKKTKDGFVGKIESVLSGSSTIDDDLFEDLEEALVTGDIGVQTAYKLLETTQERVDEEKIEDPKMIMTLLRDQVKDMLTIDAPPLDPDKAKPFVMMVVGVNGTGKTTTIGKIASMYSKQGKKVLLAAADTFRAAAIEQLEVWSQRVGCDIIKHKQGSDPGAVAFDALDAGIARGADVVIIDTAGRLHTKGNLMNELGKVKRVVKKKVEDGPHETILVLDATTGQNAIAQAKEFNKATELSGIILTKLDGTAKGGCIVGIADEFKLPIRFIGIGEKIDDLRPFDVDDFVQALF